MNVVNACRSSNPILRVSGNILPVRKSAGSPGVASALASLETRIGFVDDIYAPLAADQAVRTMSGLQRFERILDFHRLDRSFLANCHHKEKRASVSGRAAICGC
jgi:hypothetical protein